MKHLYRILLLLTLCWGLAVPQARATHQVGSDMTWRCDPTNPCLYTFTYTFYQDCPTGGSGSPPTNLAFTCQGMAAPQPAATNAWTLQNPGGTDITPVCPGQSSDCNAGTVPGVEAFIWARTFNLCTTPQCNSWTLNWSICCRSNLITSLSNAQSTASSTTSFMAFNPGQCNNSPTFNAPPVVYICNGQNTTYSMGATDPEGDQLVYTLIPCQGTTSLPLTYATGFGPNAPLGPNWNVTMNPANGNITFQNISPDVQVGVMCVRVDEVRNGQVVGSVVRDIQIRVIACTNNLPQLSNPGPINMCVGQQTCFNITSSDLDLGDNLTVTVIGAPVGPTISIGPGANPTTTICWTPTAADIGTHTIVLEVRDDACPIVGVQQFTYTINVTSCDPCDTLNINVNWTHTQSLLDITVTNQTTGSPIHFTEFIWGDMSPNEMYVGNHTAPVNHTFPGPGTYTVCVKTHTYVGDVCCHDSLCKEITVTDNPCDEHHADWYAAALISPPCTYIFYDNSTPGSTNVYWDFGQSGPLIQGSPVTYTFPSSGVYTITMYSHYFPPQKPGLCCIDSLSRTWTIWCRDRPDKHEEPGLGSASKVAWHENSATLEVIFAMDRQESSTVSVFDMNGKLLFESRDISGSEVQFDFSGVASGIYLVRTVTGDHVDTRRFARP